MQKIRFKIIPLTLTLVFATIVSSMAQRDIEPTLLFSDSVNYHFSGEWQYLSTDIYLLNAEKFTTLINELDFVRTQNDRSGWFAKRSKLSEEYLEYLFITAKLKNVRFFGDNDITYPLYNFQISKDEEEKYRTFVSDNIESIRIIDNLPLYSASDFIDAEINVRAITNNDRDQILGLVASQLQNLSKMQTPTSAMLGIIGEFGNFIESNTKKKEYRFSSTIRLFEQKNFDTRLHSIRVYGLLTANSQPIELNTEPISALLNNNDNTKLTKPYLSELIGFTGYPLIVVANYKSLYRMEQVTGDEINFASIEQRKLKIENDYKAGLINTETYRQEKDFIGFITIFANLKNHLEVYSLNYKTGNTDAISGSLFKLAQYYRQLIKAHDEIRFKYKNNSTYQNVFRSEYESILGYASLYLNDDHNLKRLQKLVSTLITLDQKAVIEKPNELEQHIEALRFADVFKPIHTDQTLLGQLIKMHTQNLEQQLFSTIFEEEIEKLNCTEATELTKLAPEPLREMVRNTSCGLCRAKALDAINSFGDRLANTRQRVALAKRDSISKLLQPWMFEQIEKVELIRNNLDSLYPSEQNNETRSYLTTKLSEAERDIKNLQDFTKIDVSDKDYALVENLNQKLVSTKQNADNALDLLCNLKPQLCTKYTSIAIDNKPKRPKVSPHSFAEQDSVVRQANVFIAIFEFQIGVIASKGIAENGMTAKIEQSKNMLESLKVTVDIYAESLDEPERTKRVEQEIRESIRQISELLSELEYLIVE